MLLRYSLVLSLLGFVGMPQPNLIAAEDAATAPALLIRLRSIDGLIADAKHVAMLAGQQEVASQFEGLVRSQMTSQGLHGIDIKRPLGAYAVFQPTGTPSSAAVLIPVADQKAVLDFLGNLPFPVKKGDDDVYTVQAAGLPLPIHFRFANQYAYVTAQDKSFIAKDKLLPPASVLPPEQTDTIYVGFRPDQVPDFLKNLAIGQFEMRLTEAQGLKVPGETKAQQELKLQIMKTAAQQFAALVNDGRQLSLRITVDQKANQLVTEYGLTAQPKSALAGMIADLGKAPLQFEVSVGAISTVLGLYPQQAMAKTVGQKAFAGNNKNHDRVRFTIEGGDALKVRLQVDGPVVSFVRLLDEEQKKASK